MSITSANSTAIIKVVSLFPQGFKLEKFSADSSIDGGDNQIAEVRMGVDGFVAAGYTPNILVVNVHLEADSPSLRYFEDWINAERSIREKYACSLTYNVTATGRSYQFSDGYLQQAKLFPDGKKVLDPRTFVIHFGDFAESPIE